MDEAVDEESVTDDEVDAVVVAEVDMSGRCV